MVKIIKKVYDDRANEYRFEAINGGPTYTAGENIQIDTTTDTISATDTKYNSGKGISIGNVTKNGRQGPSPDGFHIPLVTEWVGLKTIMTSLSLTTGDSWRINLHMPFAGGRNYSSGAVYNQGDIAYYWSSSLHDDSYPEYAKLLTFGSGYVNPVYYYYRAYGLPVRSFKDSYVTPDSTWIVVQGTLGSAGIFWNQTEGLISITDGSTGYTMMDKNLGATTVYNDGDTLSEANCGKYYQWGNNYGFPWTGDITTSSTQVDASAYGPNTANGYYSSGTFITGSQDWSSVHNDDLWGDTTGTITIENVITNTGVTSVNGETGDITIENESNVRVFTVNPFIINGTTVSQSQQDFNTLMEMGRWIAEGFSYPNNKTNRVAILRGSMGHGFTGMEFVSIVNVKTTPYYVDDNQWDCSGLSITYSGNRGGDTSYAVDFSINSSSTSIVFNSTSYGYFTPGTGTTGQVLTKTSSGYNWQDASGGLQVAPNSPITGIKYLWYGTEAQYTALTQYYTDTPGDTEFRCF